MPVAEILPAFGPFTLDLDNRSLRRSGREVALTPKSWAVLRYLLERRGRLVTKDELLNAIWPDTIVVENFYERGEAALTGTYTATAVDVTARAPHPNGGIRSYTLRLRRK